jgi:hypothetical protein
LISLRWRAADGFSRRVQLRGVRRGKLNYLRGVPAAGLVLAEH